MESYLFGTRNLQRHSGKDHSVTDLISLYSIFAAARKKDSKKICARWEEIERNSDENPWRPVVKRWDFSLLSSWFNPVPLKNTRTIFTGVWKSQSFEQVSSTLKRAESKFLRTSVTEECSGSLLHVNWTTDRQEIKVCETHGGEEKKAGGGGKLIESRGKRGKSLNPFLFSALFLVVKDTDQGLPLDAGFTSPPSVWLWRSNNLKCVPKKKGKKGVCTFEEKIWVCRTPLEMSTLSESRIPGIPGH